MFIEVLYELKYENKMPYNDYNNLVNNELLTFDFSLFVNIINKYWKMKYDDIDAKPDRGLNSGPFRIQRKLSTTLNLF